MRVYELITHVDDEHPIAHAVIKRMLIVAPSEAHAFASIERPASIEHVAEAHRSSSYDSCGITGWTLNDLGSADRIVRYG